VDTPDPGVYGDSPHLPPWSRRWRHHAGSGVLADRTYLASDLKPTLER
jgi:hypothetical protein